MSLKPITLYGHATGPNPWKVVMVLEELNIPYENKIVDFPDMKKEPFESINPNGRVPAIEDPNTGITLWESGAIVEYLVETYDKKHTISFENGSKDYFLAKQWLHYQVSGQGPYFGQAVWFTRFHPEQLESAKERYYKEIRRVSGVLDKFLADKEYLVAGKFSYVDLAFVPWFHLVGYVGIELSEDFPHLDAWLNRQKARPAISKTLKLRDEAMAAAH
ncbi:Glutathione S-transferase-like protein OpS6 [Penicillium cinerascens]|uniref:glutathione transferase n=1 Tax=Penicillium cinerascens TaxID=70096 RepID=A0A9W9M754_9EURO|nr:Glutathione S-transferase-like protein OpS6 [Penicillium cinerascens]KAJ5191378.1 Glutathione S-transferase-like protein OpS6 [Penicillium cinerascens]